MDKAFDTVIKTKVDAEEVAKTKYYSAGNRFRYQCLCCGEEVYLAAADSIIKSPHFRHRRGNNETNCEYYLGQPGAIEHFVLVRKKDQEHVSFCFNMEQKTFEFSLNLSREEIESFFDNESVFSLYSKYYSKAFFTLPIHRGNLIPNTDNYFMIDEYSNDYYVSFDNSDVKIKYSDVIKNCSEINIYNVNMENCHYKRNTSNNLFTKNTYLAISENMNYIAELINGYSVLQEDEAFSFITLGKTFFAVKFIIKSVDYNSKVLFQKHGLNVESCESLDILWPPVFTRNNDTVSSRERIYLISSFALIPRGNIDSSEATVREVDNSVFELCFKNSVFIIEKNVERKIIHEKYEPSELTYEAPQQIYSNKYTIPDSQKYYLFDKNGCTQLMTGTVVYLSEGDYIIGYKNGHIKVVIFAEKKKEKDKKSVIQEIIKYHPKSELFVPDDFMNITVDETVLSYIESCYRSGQINSVVKKYIKEGLI